MLNSRIVTLSSLDHYRSLDSVLPVGDVLLVVTSVVVGGGGGRGGGRRYNDPKNSQTRMMYHSYDFRRFRTSKLCRPSNFLRDASLRDGCRSSSESRRFDGFASGDIDGSSVGIVSVVVGGGGG